MGISIKDAQALGADVDQPALKGEALRLMHAVGKRRREALGMAEPAPSPSMVTPRGIAPGVSEEAPDIDVTFTVKVQPYGKGRPRASVVGDGHIRMRTPDKTRDWCRLVQMHAQEALDGVPLIEGPVRVDVAAVFTRPKMLHRRKDPPGLLWHTRRPDADNVGKAILDALAPFWRDDAQVCSCVVRKFYAEKGAGPRVVVRITRPGRAEMEEP